MTPKRVLVIVFLIPAVFLAAGLMLWFGPDEPADSNSAANKVSSDLPASASPDGMETARLNSRIDELEAEVERLTLVTQDQRKLLLKSLANRLEETSLRRRESEERSERYFEQILSKPTPSNVFYPGFETEYGHFESAIEEWGLENVIDYLVDFLKPIVISYGTERDEEEREEWNRRNIAIKLLGAINRPEALDAFIELLPNDEFAWQHMRHHLAYLPDEVIAPRVSTILQAVGEAHEGDWLKASDLLWDLGFVYGYDEAREIFMTDERLQEYTRRDALTRLFSNRAIEIRTPAAYEYLEWLAREMPASTGGEIARRFLDDESNDSTNQLPLEKALQTD